MTSRQLVLVGLVALLFHTGCKTIQQNQNSGGTQTVVQGVQANITYAGEGKGGILIKDGEAISNISLKDKNNTPVTVTLDPAVSTELQSVDPAPAGYHWVGFRAAGISSSLAPYSLSYNLTDCTTPHSVKERASLGQSWVDPDSSLVYSFDVGPSAIAGHGMTSWGIALLLVVLLTVSAWQLRRRFRPE
jgi:hypothetical protein